MARAIFINAILRGKLGGTVYAFNKGGPYVRQYRVPTNPNTVAQADARDEFAAAVTSWHLLTDEQKAMWNTYGTSNFRGKNNDPTVLYSGFNAFVSLWNESKNSNRTARPYTLEGNGTNVLTFSEEDFSLSNLPPTNIFSANIQDYQGNPLGVTLLSAFLAIDGKARINLGFFASPGPQVDAPEFVEPNTQLPVGYVFYASNVVGQAESFVTKPNQTIIGTFKPPKQITGWVDGDYFIEFEFNQTLTTIPDHKLWYNEGDVCRVECWAVGAEGPIIRVGEDMTTVLAALP